MVVEQRKITIKMFTQKLLKRWFTGRGAVAGLLLPTIIIMVILSFMHKNFMTVTNQINIIRSVSVYTIAAIGMTFVIGVGGIDLSIGAALGMIVSVVGSVLESGLHPLLAMVIGLILGTLIGLFNGLIITKLKVPPLITTIGMMVALRGAAQLYLGPVVHHGFPMMFQSLGRGFIGPIPNPVIFAVFSFAIGIVMLASTRLGKYALAIGGNREAARLAGVKVDFWETGVYMFGGFMVGLASLVQMSRMDAAYAAFGEGLELHVITTVILGGTLLTGGRANIIGTVIGVILIGVLENGLVLSGVHYFWQRVILGLLLIFAVALQAYRERTAK
ncbi:Ribose import permease protein RbsC [subsurface metagenome]